MTDPPRYCCPECDALAEAMAKPITAEVVERLQAEHHPTTAADPAADNPEEDR